MVLLRYVKQQAQLLLKGANYTALFGIAMQHADDAIPDVEISALRLFTI